MIAIEEILLMLVKVLMMSVVISFLKADTLEIEGVLVVECLRCKCVTANNLCRV